MDEDLFGDPDEDMGEDQGFGFGWLSLQMKVGMVLRWGPEMRF